MKTLSAKIPAEAIIISGDFVDLLDVGVTISSVTASVTTERGTDTSLVAATPSFIGSVVATKVTGGVDASIYIVSLVAVCSDGETIIGQLRLPVLAFPPNG